jgi:Secretion system C-terminal sorting domain
MTIWTFQQYTNNTDSWGLRAIQLRAPAPATPTSPGTIGCGTSLGGGNRSTAITLNGSSVSNSEFFDPGADAGGPGFANRLNVTTTGTGASITGISFVNPTQITFNVTWPNALAGTTQTLTITNPDCQSVTTTYTLPTGCSSLPVTYVSFNGKEVNKKVLLSWETSFETDNQYFEMEKKNVNDQFETIGLVDSKGVTTGSAYKFIDHNPSSLNYYRIKQVNTDNSFSYSSTISVKVLPSGKFLLYPNPVQNMVSIETPSSYAKGTIKIMSVTGLLVYTTGIKEPIMQVDMSQFASGTYIVEIRAVTGEKQQKKLSIEKPVPKP